MTPGVFSVGPSTALDEILRVMLSNGASFVVITSMDKKPEGVITERDIMRLLSSNVSLSSPVCKFMSSPVRTVMADDTAYYALRCLVSKKIRHLVVVDSSGVVEGTLTLTDFLGRLGLEYFKNTKSVSHVMDTEPAVFTPETSLEDVVSYMSGHSREVVVVADKGGDAVGIFTERDSIRIFNSPVDIGSLVIGDVMSSPLVDIPADAKVLESIFLMQKENIRHLVVRDAKGLFRGLVSQSDLINGIEFGYTGFIKKVLDEHDEKLKKVNAGLEKAVKERTSELNLQNQALLKEIKSRQKAESKLEKSRQSLKNLADYLLEVREEERKRVSRDIHDELGQMLSASKLDLLWIGKRIKAEQSDISEKLKGLVSMMDESIDTVQRIVSELRPPMLDDLGLEAMLRWHVSLLSKRSGIDFDVNISADMSDIDRRLSVAIFRVVQEALTNIMRHSGATKAGLTMAVDRGNVVVEVSDNGVGISNKMIRAQDSFGLIGMGERLSPWNGRLKISRQPEGGTSVCVSIPLGKNRRGKKNEMSCR